MIPELLRLLKENKKMSLTDLSILSKQKLEVIEQILEQLVRKGKVKKENIACFGCMKDCSACVARSDLIYYEITEDEAADPKSN
ncbi:MAG: FeoC-like transcriptional regulator [Candidatus Cloacimonadia bacterium]